MAGIRGSGRPVDHRLLGRFVGASYDGCVACQRPLLASIVQDAVTSARLIELACVAVHDMFGGLPAVLTDETAPGPASAPFRRLARTGLDDANDAMYVRRMRADDGR